MLGRIGPKSHKSALGSCVLSPVYKIFEILLAAFVMSVAWAAYTNFIDSGAPKMWHIQTLIIIVPVWALVFIIKHKYESLEKNAHRDEMRTMPPKGMMVSFGRLCDEFRKAKQKAYLLQSKTEIDKAIRFALDSLSNALELYMGADNTVRYAANVMLYRPKSTISKEEEDAIIADIEPWWGSATLVGMRGILELDPELSASTDSPGDPFSKDNKITAVRLPVADIGIPGKVLLPGAPTAFSMEQGFDVISNTHLFRKTYQNSGLSNKVLEAIETYFKGDGGDVKSFLSISVKTLELTGHYDNGILTKLTEEDGAVGVVNIHSSTPYMFGEELDQQRIVSYRALCQPFIGGIVELLEFRREIISN